MYVRKKSDIFGYIKYQKATFCFSFWGIYLRTLQQNKKQSKTVSQGDFKCIKM